MLDARPCTIVIYRVAPPFYLFYRLAGLSQTDYDAMQNAMATSGYCTFYTMAMFC